MPVMTEARGDYKLELATEVLRSGGAIRLQALGTSMLPSVWPGDVLSIAPAPGKDIVPGDIVLVARDGRFFIHRLIQKDETHWITRGDSLAQNDPPLAEAQVLGKVSLIHRTTGDIVPKPRVSPSRSYACLDAVPMGLVPERFPPYSFIPAARRFRESYH